jgi:hypothetical protein
MRIFISYKFRKRNKGVLKKILEHIADALEKAGHQTYIFFRDEKKWQEKDIPLSYVITKLFGEIKKATLFLALLDHQGFSQGMLLEYGLAKSLNKKTILLIAEKASAPIMEATCDQVIKFNKIDDLSIKLKKLGF